MDITLSKDELKIEAINERGQVRHVETIAVQRNPPVKVDAAKMAAKKLAFKSSATKAAADKAASAEAAVQKAANEKEDAEEILRKKSSTAQDWVEKASASKVAAYV